MLHQSVIERSDCKFPRGKRPAGVRHALSCLRIVEQGNDRRRHLLRSGGPCGGTGRQCVVGGLGEIEHVRSDDDRAARSKRAGGVA